MCDGNLVVQEVLIMPTSLSIHRPGVAGAVLQSLLLQINSINLGLSKRQEVCFTPLTKVEKFIVIFLDLFGET